MDEPVTKDSPLWMKARWMMRQSSAFASAPIITDEYLSDLSTNALNAILSKRTEEWSIEPIEVIRLIHYIRALENRDND